MSDEEISLGNVWGPNGLTQAVIVRRTNLTEEEHADITAALLRRGAELRQKWEQEQQEQQDQGEEES